MEKQYLACPACGEEFNEEEFVRYGHSIHNKNQELEHKLNLAMGALKITNGKLNKAGIRCTMAEEVIRKSQNDTRKAD